MKARRSALPPSSTHTFKHFATVHQLIAFEAGAGVRRRAFSEGFAGDVAKRLADVLHRLISADPVTFVAGAHCRTRAGAVHARFLADRLADVARVT